MLSERRASGGSSARHWTGPHSCTRRAHLQPTAVFSHCPSSSLTLWCTGRPAGSCLRPLHALFPQSTVSLPPSVPGWLWPAASLPSHLNPPLPREHSAEFRLSIPYLFCDFFVILQFSFSLCLFISHLAARADCTVHDDSDCICFVCHYKPSEENSACRLEISAPWTELPRDFDVVKFSRTSD